MSKRFLKSSRPSLPLKKAPPLISVFFNGLYTPFGSPVCGGQKPQGREDVTALRCSEPLRSKVGGPSKVFAMVCGMGPPDYYLNYLKFPSKQSVTQLSSN